MRTCARIAWSSVLAVALVTGAVGCGPPSRPTAAQLSAAESNAVSACGQMLTLGNFVVTNRTVSSASAARTLDKAVTYAQQAANVDSAEWGPLETNIAKIRTSLESGHRAGLSVELTQLGNLCAPLSSNGD